MGSFARFLLHDSILTIDKLVRGFICLGELGKITQPKSIGGLGCW